jgi:hypothetical protein
MENISEKATTAYFWEHNTKIQAAWVIKAYSCTKVGLLPVDLNKFIVTDVKMCVWYLKSWMCYYR